MNRNRLIVFVLLSLFALAGMYGKGFEADIPFEFHAGAKVLPPGTYSFVFDESSHEVVIARAGVHVVEMPILTRLGRRDSSDEGTLVFDKYNGVRSLSEVWIQAIDGFLVHSIPEEHVHELVSVKPRGDKVASAN